MKVINETRFPIVAFGFHTQAGYGADVKILPGQFAEVNGPCVGKTGDRNDYIYLSGAIVCNEAPDDGSRTRFLVARGRSLSIGHGDRGLTVRHHCDPPEEPVIRWRKNNPHVEAL